MRPSLRLVAIVLLFALPLQTWAVAGRFACADQPASWNAAAQPTTPHAHGTAAGSHAHDASVGSSLAGVPYQAPAAAGDAVPGTCAYCAVCCVGAALVDWAAQLVAPRAAQVDYPPQTAAPCPQPFDGPERPPRTF